MSFTETQLLHRLNPATTRIGIPTATSATAFILSNEQEEKGLTMKIDNKVGDTLVRPMQLAGGGSGKSPVTSQFCGYTSSLSGWILRSAMCLQKAHLTTASFVSHINETIQKKAVKILTVFLYMSLLVLAIQSVVIIVLLVQTHLPLGMWFLFICVSVLGWIFWTTAIITEPTTYLSTKVINNCPVH